MKACPPIGLLAPISVPPPLRKEAVIEPKSVLKIAAEESAEIVLDAGINEGAGEPGRHQVDRLRGIRSDRTTQPAKVRQRQVRAGTMALV